MFRKAAEKKIRTKMPRKVNQISFNEGKARSTAWAVTFGDMVTLLLTFFILPTKGN